ncbi:MAG: thymidine phosphorylase, partial [Cephaloticoccus sp.]
PAVGVADLVKIGEPVRAGATLCTVHASDEAKARAAAARLAGAIRVADVRPPDPRLIAGLMG